MDLATDIAAEPTALPITDSLITDSTAFCVTAFGINVNIDIAVFESTHQSDRACLPFAAWMYAYRLYAESEQPTIATNSQIKRNPKTQKTTKRSLRSIEFDKKTTKWPYSALGKTRKYDYPPSSLFRDAAFKEIKRKIRLFSRNGRYWRDHPRKSPTTNEDPPDSAHWSFSQHKSPSCASARLSPTGPYSRSRTSLRTDKTE